MSKSIFFVGLVWLFMGCGVRDMRDEKPSVVGVWDNTVCRDRLALNEDLTFAWNDSGVSSGSYWLEGNQINFKFSNKIPETYQFKVTERELTLLKGNAQYEYVKVPPVLVNGKYVIPPAQNYNSANFLCNQK